MHHNSLPVNVLMSREEQLVPVFMLLTQYSHKTCFTWQSADSWQCFIYVLGWYINSLYLVLPTGYSMNAQIFMLSKHVKLQGFVSCFLKLHSIFLQHNIFLSNVIWFLSLLFDVLTIHICFKSNINPSSWQSTICCYCYRWCASTAIPGRPGPPTIVFEKRTSYPPTALFNIPTSVAETKVILRCLLCSTFHKY